MDNSSESEGKAQEVKPYAGHTDEDQNVIRTSFNYVQEVKTARYSREQLNRANYDAFHLRQDTSHKNAGQSREFLPKQYMAVEQISQFVQQSLLELEDWNKVEPLPGVTEEEMLIKPNEIRLMSNRQLEKADFYTMVGDAVKLGLLSSLMICKVHGKYVDKPFYRAVNKFDTKRLKFKKALERGVRKVWQLDLTLIPFENFYLDPSGKGLYKMHEAYLDWHEVDALSKGDEAIYDPKIVQEVKNGQAIEWNNQIDYARRTAQNNAAQSNRKKVKIQEFWGSIVDQTTGELLAENVVWTVANDSYLIQKPTPNPYWHQEDPFVVSPIVRVPTSAYHRALMDAGTRLNIAENELFNLILDGGMMGVYGIKQYRSDWMEDDSAVSEGFFPGMSVAANSSCPPGEKVLERVDTSSVPPEAMNILNLISAEGNQAMLTNDLRMGAMSQRAVKATEVVEASQSLNSVFSGMEKVIEINFIEKICDKAWKVGLQHYNDMDSGEMQSLLGKERALAIDAMGPEERFASCVEKSQFVVHGLSKSADRMKDFRKYTAFLQTIASAPVLLQQFMQKYSMPRFMGEIMRSLDINTARLEMNEAEKQAAQAQMQQAMAMTEGAAQGDNGQSQIPQAGGQEMGEVNPGPNNPAGNMNFPPQALSAMGGG